MECGRSWQRRSGIASDIKNIDRSTKRCGLRQREVTKHKEKVYGELCERF